MSPKGYSKEVKFDGMAVAIRGASFKSMGDVASKGTGGGIVSNNVEGETKFIAPGSLTVQVEGKAVQLLSDVMSNNNGPSGSPPNAATLAGTIHMASISGVSGVGKPEKCQSCKEAKGQKTSAAKPYDDFFDEADKAELAKIEAANPDLGAMLPPKGALYQVLSTKRCKAARDKWHRAKYKAEMAGEYHHPHPIKAGGCPVHQPVVAKPDKDPEKSRVDAVDKQIQAVVNKAIDKNG